MYSPFFIFHFIGYQFEIKFEFDLNKNPKSIPLISSF